MGSKSYRTDIKHFESVLARMYVNIDVLTVAKLSEACYFMCGLTPIMNLSLSAVLMQPTTQRHCFPSSLQFATQRFYLLFHSASAVIGLRRILC